MTFIKAKNSVLNFITVTLWFGHGAVFNAPSDCPGFFFKNMIKASPQQATGNSLALLVHVPLLKGFALLLGAQLK